MCFICLRDDPFKEALQNLNDLDKVRNRYLFITSLLNDVEKNVTDLCYIGDAVVQRLSRELTFIKRSL